MVRMIRWGVFVAVVAATWAFGSLAATAEPTAAGVWKQIDPDTKKVGGLIQIREKKGQWEGYIIKMFSHPGDPVDPVCSGCTDDRKDKPVLGIRLIQNLKRDGSTYEDGTILDPRNGNEYNVKLTLSDDGQTLTVRGYVGVSLLGQSQEWTRLSDDEVAKLDSDPDARLIKDTDKDKPKSKKKKKKKKDQATTPPAASPSAPAPSTDAPAPAAPSDSK